jgi:hypothetical protein
LKPYRQRGFQNSGEKINDRFAEANRLKAGGLNPLGGKSMGPDPNNLECIPNKLTAPKLINTD